MLRINIWIKGWFIWMIMYSELKFKVGFIGSMVIENSVVGVG